MVTKAKRELSPVQRRNRREKIFDDQKLRSVATKMTKLFKFLSTASLSSCASTLFIFLILSSPYRCDNSDSNLTSGSVNVSNFIVNSKTSSKSGIDSSNNNQQATFTSEDIQNSHQIPLVRLPSNTLLKYTAYKDVSIQHFLIPMDSRSALFSFKAYEESKSALSKSLPYS